MCHGVAAGLERGHRRNTYEAVPQPVVRVQRAEDTDVAFDLADALEACRAMHAREATEAILRKLLKASKVKLKAGEKQRLQWD